MIIDVTREMNDEEYEKYQDLLERYWKKHDYLHWYDVNYFPEDEYHEELNEKMINVITVEEENYLADLEARTMICAGEFRHERKWYVQEGLSDFNILFWLRREEITDYFLIREILFDNQFWLCLKNFDDHKLCQAKWKGHFDSDYLIEHGWFKQEMGPDEQIKWAAEYLGDHFLYDYKSDSGYFRNGTEAVLKLRWYE